jgi:hypothetical protein
VIDLLAKVNAERVEAQCINRSAPMDPYWTDEMQDRNSANHLEAPLQMQYPMAAPHNAGGYG